MFKQKRNTKTSPAGLLGLILAIWPISRGVSSYSHLRFWFSLRNAPFEWALTTKCVCGFVCPTLQIRTLQQLLPGLDAYMLVYKSPRLLTSAHLSKIVPTRLAAMERLLPGVDVQR